MSKSDLVEKEVKSASKEVADSAEKKEATTTDTVTTDKKKQFLKQHNVIIVRKTANFKTLVV